MSISKMEAEWVGMEGYSTRQGPNCTTLCTWVVEPFKIKNESAKTAAVCMGNNPHIQWRKVIVWIQHVFSQSGSSHNCRLTALGKPGAHVRIRELRQLHMRF